MDRTAFNDITSGNNKCGCEQASLAGAVAVAVAVCCPTGFDATEGWDPVTGLGSVNFEKFKSELLTGSVRGSPAPPHFQPPPPPPPPACSCQAAQAGASDKVTPLPDGKTITYRGKSYRTLDNVNPSVSEESCQNGEMHVADGWEQAPDDVDSRTVAASFPWGTTCVIMKSGLSYNTKVGRHCPKFPSNPSAVDSGGQCGPGVSCDVGVPDDSRLIQTWGTAIRVTSCSRRVLLVKAHPNAATASPRAYWSGMYTEPSTGTVNTMSVDARRYPSTVLVAYKVQCASDRRFDSQQSDAYYSARCTFHSQTRDYECLPTDGFSSSGGTTCTTDYGLQGAISKDGTTFSGKLTSRVLTNDAPSISLVKSAPPNSGQPAPILNFGDAVSSGYVTNAMPGSNSNDDPKDDKTVWVWVAGGLGVATIAALMYAISTRRRVSKLESELEKLKNGPHSLECLKVSMGNDPEIDDATITA